MNVSTVVAQLRTTDLAGSIDFYTARLGFVLAFRYQDFYAGIRAGEQLFHLKQVDRPDPSVAEVTAGGHFHLYFQIDDAQATAAALQANGLVLLQGVHDTAWQTREFILRDDQGHTLYFGQALEPSPTPAGART